MKKSEPFAIEVIAYGLVGVVFGALVAIWVAAMAAAARLT